jgi:hypothetical protein
MAGPRTRIIIYDEKLRIFLNTPHSGDRKDLWKYIERRLKLTVAAAKRDVGVKTGALRGSIFGYHLGNATGQYAGVRAVRPYALMHHNGTKPHIIEASSASKLVFMKGSRIIRTQIVRHPGTRPNPFLAKNLYILAGVKAAE